MKRFRNRFIKKPRTHNFLESIKDFAENRNVTLKSISEVSESEKNSSLTENSEGILSSFSTLVPISNAIPVSSFLKKFLKSLQKHQKVYFFFYRSLLADSY